MNLGPGLPSASFPFLAQLPEFPEKPSRKHALSSLHHLLSFFVTYWTSVSAVSQVRGWWLR